MLEEAHLAVRLGGDLDIHMGADFRSDVHNEIMYGVRHIIITRLLPASHHDQALC